MITSVLLLPKETNKLIFYGIDFIGEIDLSAYPFDDELSSAPNVKVFRF